MTSSETDHKIIYIHNPKFGAICQIPERFKAIEEHEANAKLISKAPEMLEMLKDILEAQDNGDTYHSYKIEQLIKEATTI